MTKNVSITIDIPVARRMLMVAGFPYDEISRATEDEIFEKVLVLNECYGVSFKAGGNDEGPLSHVMMVEVVYELGPHKMDEVVLFNINRISKEEALRYVGAGEYNPNVLVMSKEQWISLFKDGKEQSV